MRAAHTCATLVYLIRTYISSVRVYIIYIYIFICIYFSYVYMCVCVCIMEAPKILARDFRNYQDSDVCGKTRRTYRTRVEKGFQFRLSSIERRVHFRIFEDLPGNFFPINSIIASKLIKIAHHASILLNTISSAVRHDRLIRRQVSRFAKI